jgi:hypothetical protein
VAVNPDGIDYAYAAARNRGDGEPAIFATGRKQLQRIARSDLKHVGEPRPDNDGIWIVPKIIEIASGELVSEIRGLEMLGRIYTEKVDGRIIESSPRADGSA